MPATKAQVKKFMDRQRLATFCMIGAHETPHAVPIWFTYTNGAVYVHTDRGSVKVRNLRRNRRACVVVCAGDGAVIIAGRTRIVPPAEFRRRTAEQIRKYWIRLDDQGRDPMGIPAFDHRTQCVIEVRPDKVRYW
jgi:nitroimidazol reductase NimA-like FMN-containing flavoprotein (pyridoxamine 5'-phosphate oxidase superfamily)